MHVSSGYLPTINDIEVVFNYVDTRATFWRWVMSLQLGHEMPNCLLQFLYCVIIIKSEELKHRAICATMCKLHCGVWVIDSLKRDWLTEFEIKYSKHVLL